MKTKKIPMRMCLGCNEMKSKRDMIRVVKAPSGEVSLDFTGGAYVCKNIECFRKARKARRFEKSLSCMIEESVFEEMENELTAENN